MKVGGIEIKTINELMQKEMKPVKWLLENLIPQGLTLLAGDPKTGKSFFAMQLALTVSAGRPFCKDGPQTCQGNVLYFLLDDYEDRLFYRFHNYLEVLADVNEIPNLSNIFYTCQWFQKDSDKHLSEFIKNNNIVLVIIDVLSSIWQENNTKKNVYHFDYEQMSRFRNIVNQT